MIGLRSLLGAAVLVLAAVAAALYLTGRSSPAAPMSSAPPVADTPAATWAAGKRRAPAFALTDQRGRPVSLAALRGRPVIITFIDPLCRDFCPLEAQHLNDVVRSFPAARKPAIVAVSVNVYGNTHAILAQDVRKWRLVPAWRWAVGREAELSRVWRAYGVEVQVATKKISGVTVHTIGHTEAAYVIDANGFERALFLGPTAQAASCRRYGCLRRKPTRSSTRIARPAIAASTISARLWLVPPRVALFAGTARGRATLTPDAAASFCTAVSADASKPPAPRPTGILASTAYSFVAGCFTQ